MPDRVRILYIDDSALDRDLVRDALEIEHGGFALTEARNREEFLSKLDTERFDLVLTDFNIHGYEGLQVLDVVKGRDPDLPVVIVTGTGSEEIAVEAMKKGASDYVIKSPQHIRRLPLTITQAINNQNAQVERRRAVEALAESERRYRALSESLEETVRERTEQLRTLATRAALAERDERHRIARILHDDLQQLLYSLKLKMPLLGRGQPPSDLIEGVDRILDRAIERTRTLTIDLSPPVLEGEGLVEALRWLAHQMEELHGLEVQIEVEDEMPPLEPSRRVMLFQFARELLFNVVKHAEVDEARITLYAERSQLRIRVQDQGQGFDPAVLETPEPDRMGFGLSTIRQRLDLFDGGLEVDARPGGGAAVTLVMPLTPTSAN